MSMLNSPSSKFNLRVEIFLTVNAESMVTVKKQSRMLDVVI